MYINGKLSALIKLIRPLNFLITFLSVIVAALISSEADAFFRFPGQIKIIFFAALSAAFTASAGYVINDYFDVNIDKINRPVRPLASGIIKRNEAAVIYFFLFLASLALSCLVNIFALLIVLTASSLLFLYSYKLKKITLVGNFLIAFLTGLAFVYGGIAVNNISNTVFPAIFAFLINLTRELIKDIEDLEGDKKGRVLTFPGKYGISNTILLINCITGALIVSTFIPFVLKIYKIEFTIIAAVIINPVLIYFIKSLNENLSLKSLHKLSNILKLDMAFGLAAIYFGK